MRCISTAAVLVASLFAFAPTALAQRVDVQDLDSRAFAVHVNAGRGSTPERAGVLAMERACEESLERNFTHLGVVQYKTELESTSAETQSAGTDYNVTGQGQVYSTPRSVQSTTITWGNAVLQVQLMNEGVATTPGGINTRLQIVDARSCSVVH